MDRKGFAPIIILLIAAGILIIGATGYFYSSNHPQIRTPIIQPAPFTSVSSVSVPTTTSTPVVIAPQPSPSSPTGAEKVASKKSGIQPPAGPNQPAPIQPKKSQQIPADVFFDFSVPAPKKIVFVVDASTYQKLMPEIDRFANDIAADLKTSVKILDKSYSSPSEVKTALIEEKNNNGDFQGVIFIGDIPWQYLSIKGVPIITAEETLNEGMAPAVSDSWYLDLEDRNVYAEKVDNCQRYALLDKDGRCMSSYLEIENWGGSEKHIYRWGGRIMPPLGRPDRMELLKRYFDRNHDYRRGNIKYEGALIYAPDHTLNPCTQHDECFSAAKKHYVDETRTTTADKLTVIAAVSPGEDTKAAYLSKQKELHRFELVNAHGGPYGFLTETQSGEYGGHVEYPDLTDNKPGGLFTEFTSCSVGAFDQKDNLATGYLFEGNGLANYSPSITVFGSSPFGSNPIIGEPSPFILGLGGRLYEVLRTNPFSTILGDPTIRINEPPKEDCKLAFAGDVSPTGIDFNARIYKNGIENTGEWKSIFKHVKIKNVGSDTCHIIDGIVLEEGWSAGFSYDLWGRERWSEFNLHTAHKDNLDPGEIVEFDIQTGPPEYTNSLWGADQTTRDSASLKFLTNGSQYLNSIPIKATWTKM